MNRYITEQNPINYNEFTTNLQSNLIDKNFSFASGYEYSIPIK